MRSPAVRAGFRILQSTSAVKRFDVTQGLPARAAFRSADRRGAEPKHAAGFVPPAGKGTAHAGCMRGAAEVGKSLPSLFLSFIGCRSQVNVDLLQNPSSLVHIVSRFLFGDYSNQVVVAALTILE